MPKLDLMSLERELERGTIRPLYVFVGAERHLARRGVEGITAAIRKCAGEAEVTALSGREVRPAEAIEALRSMSLLGGRPLVVIREGEALAKGALDALADYISAPVDGSTLVVVADKLDGRGRFMLAAMDKGAVIECKPLYLNQVPSWINGEAKRRGRQISQDAARFLADMVGADLGQLSQALERLILYAGERKLIERSDVEEAVAETHQRSIFELTDAWGGRRWPEVLALIRNILEQGEPPAMVLNMLARHLRILSKAKEAAGRMEDGPALARYLGVHPYFLRNYVSQSNNFSSEELRSAFRALHECDRELKSSRIAKEIILEKGILSFLGRERLEGKGQRAGERELRTPRGIASPG